MKRNALFPMLVAVVLLTSCLTPVFPQSEDTRNLNSFEGFGISVHADVYYTQGNGHEIRIEGSERDVRDLVTEVRDGFLQVKYDDKRMKRSKLTIYITSEKLEAVRVSGSAKVMADKGVSSDELDLALSGSGGIAFSNLDSEEIGVKISGSGSVQLKGGSAEEIDVMISGSGKLLAEDFEVSECSATVSGSGSVQVNVADEIDARISGSGHVRYKGDPQVHSVTSGSGKVVSM